MNITLQLKRGVQNFASNWGVHELLVLYMHLCPNLHASLTLIGRVVQYTHTVTVRISHVSIRTDRMERQQGYTVCKVCFTVRKLHLISGT